MVYEADTLMEIIRTGWTLTGRLVIEGTAAAASSPKPILLFAREQVKDKIKTKAIEVHKKSPLKSERINEFFTEETDEFLIKIVYKLQGEGKTSWDLMEGDVEDIETEINRIIKTTYNPQTGIGIFFRSTLTWTDADDINNDKQDPILVRELRILLTRFRSRSDNVFDSFQKGVIFDLSASSNMDSAPGADFSYTEVFEVESFEGFSTIGVQVNNHPDGKGVPLLYDGGFGGTLIMKSYLRSDDIGSTADKINQIYKRQANGEKVEVALVRTFTNNNSQTLTKTTIVRIIEVREAAPSSEANALLTWQYIGKIIKPSVWSVA